MSKSTQSIESPLNPNHPGNENDQFDFDVFESKGQRLFLVSGQSGSGKSTLTGVMSDIARLYDDPLFLLVDAEEGANKTFGKTNPEKVKNIRLMEPIHYDHLVDAHDTAGKAKGVVDLPGTSLEGVRRAINFGRLSESKVEIIPIIVVGLRANAETVAMDWVELYGNKGIKKLYWVWNNQDPSQPDNRELPKLPEKHPDIIEIRIPALDPKIAKILVSEGISPRKILAGGCKDRPELSNRNAIAELGGWLRQFVENARPLLEDLKS
jgi:energy-coupling factor transporter ATP-binding protein EcfA2